MESNIKAMVSCTASMQVNDPNGTGGFMPECGIEVSATPLQQNRQIKPVGIFGGFVAVDGLYSYPHPTNPDRLKLGILGDVHKGLYAGGGVSSDNLELLVEGGFTLGTRSGDGNSFIGLIGGLSLPVSDSGKELVMRLSTTLPPTDPDWSNFGLSFGVRR